MVPDFAQVPHDARQVVEWLCGEYNDAGLGRALLRMRRGEWRDDELGRLERTVGNEVERELRVWRKACKWRGGRGERVASLEELRTPRAVLGPSRKVRPRCAARRCHIHHASQLPDLPHPAGFSQERRRSSLRFACAVHLPRGGGNHRPVLRCNPEAPCASRPAIWRAAESAQKVTQVSKSQLCLSGRRLAQGLP